MRRRAPFLALLAALCVAAAACGGDGKPSAEECAEEAAKLFRSVDDLDQIDEKIEALQDKGCQDVGTDVDDGSQGSGSPGATDGDLSRLQENVSSECLELSGQIAAKGREALAEVDDAESRRRLNDELKALQDDLKDECPQYGGP